MEKYDDPPLVKMRRQVGSGAFGNVDPILKGDIKGEIGRLLLLFEAKSWDQVDGRGAKTVSFPVALIDKIEAEALTEDRFPIFVYHPKGSQREIAFCYYDRLHALLKEAYRQLMAYESQLSEER